MMVRDRACPHSAPEPYKVIVRYITEAAKNVIW